MDPNKTQPPMPKITFKEMMAQMDRAIFLPRLMEDFTADLMAVVDDTDKWVGLNFIQLNAVPYEIRKPSERETV